MTKSENARRRFHENMKEAKWLNLLFIVTKAAYETASSQLPNLERLHYRRLSSRNVGLQWCELLIFAATSSLTFRSVRRISRSANSDAE